MQLYDLKVKNASPTCRETPTTGAFANLELLLLANIPTFLRVLI